MSMFAPIAQQINDEVGHIGIKFRVNEQHLRERARQRGINFCIIRDALEKFCSNHICEFIYHAYQNEQIRPFQLELRTDMCIVVLSRRGDYTWVANTCLNPSIHNLHPEEKISFCKTINV